MFRLPEVARRFLPVIWPVLLVLLITGSLLIIGEPRRSLLNTTFYFKMASLAAAVVLTAGLQWSLAVGAGILGRKSAAAAGGRLGGDRFHPDLVRRPVCRPLDRLYAGRLMLTPSI